MPPYSEFSLTLLTRPACHLCEEAAAALKTLAVEFDTIDIDSNEELVGRYGDEIPVLLAADVAIASAPFSVDSLAAVLRNLRAKEQAEG